MAIEWTLKVELGDVILAVSVVLAAAAFWFDRKTRTLQFASESISAPHFARIRGLLDEWIRLGYSPKRAAKEIENLGARDRQALSQFLQAVNRVATGCCSRALSRSLVLRTWKRRWLRDRYAIASEFLKARTIQRRDHHWPYPDFRRLCGWQESLCVHHRPFCVPQRKRKRRFSSAS